MGYDYFIFYTIASAVCVIILLMMLITDRLYRTLQEKQVLFNRAIVTFILYFISDAFWAAVLSGQLPRTRLLVGLFNLTNYILLSMLTYGWFMYMAASEKMAFRTSRQKRLLYMLPMLVSCLGFMIAYAAAPHFWISEECELNGLYYPLMLAAPTFYLLTAFIFSVYNARRTELRAEKRLYWMIGLFPLGVMAFGLLQFIGLNAPTFCFGCTITLLWFYIQNMQTLISADALTKLNNRGEINRCMEQVHYREGVKVYLLMIDIDRFKEINDTYGHAEGDRALILTADALKQVCERCKSSIFLGRYGGDEFTIIIQSTEQKNSAELAAEALRGTLAEKQRENRLPYALEVSVGYDMLRGRGDTMQACMLRADEKLYAEKRAKA